MTKSLVIVESPTKARTISGFLGPEATVESSMGHIRDLPRSAAEIPAKAKGESWARLGVNTEDDFAPLYVVPKERKAHVKKLKDGASYKIVLARDGTVIRKVREARAEIEIPLER